jgi:hypothetical protein
MNSVSRWRWRRSFGVAALAVTSGAAGWTLGHHGHNEPDQTPANVAGAPATTVPRSPEAHGAGAAIETSADGTVSIHVDPVSADGLLSELGRHGAEPPGAGAPTIDGTTTVSDFSCEAADEKFDIVNVEVLTQTLAQGSESERYAALTRVLEAGIDLPPELLRHTYASDPSERVRLLAFTTYVDSVSDDRAGARAALESGASNDSSVVQTEAQRRLAQLEQFERMLAETPPPGLP